MKRIISFILVFLYIFLISGCGLSSKSSNIVLDISNTLKDSYGGGKGVRIAIIDSGIDVTYTLEEYVLNFSKEDSASDNMDHGTPIYNIISNAEYGLSPEATVYSLKVINKYGNASTTNIVNALEWCLNNSIDIINMSLSFGLYNENIECLVSELIQAGVIIVASINNISKDIDYPSMYDSVICVGATDTPEIYDKSSSIIFDGNYTVKAMGVDGKVKDYVGNSFLAPIVTGTIACLIDKTTKERGRTSEELVEVVKYVLTASNVNIM